MGDRPHYVRVYYSINDDPRFDTIRSDDASFATWVRLLMTADAVWPASADLPRWVKAKPLQALIDAGLVEPLPNERFKIHGLDAERERRSEAGRIGGLASGRSRNAERPFNDRSTDVEPARAEQSKSKDEHRVRMNGSSPKCAVDPAHPMVESSYGRWWCAVCEERVPA